MWGAHPGATVRAALTRSLSVAVAALLCSLPLGACAKAPAEGEVAKVVAVKGAVKIERSGAADRVAEAGVALLPSDTVKVPRGGLAVLQLAANGYLVRIDEELALVVGELALFGAPRTKVSAEAQLDALLSPEEKKGLNERMAGFYAATSAAEAQPSRHVKEKAVASTESDTAPPPPVAAARPPEEEAPGPKTQPARPGPAPGSPPPAPAAVAPAEPPAEKKVLRTFGQNTGQVSPVGAGGSAKEARAEPSWASAAQQAELKTCLWGHVNTLGARARMGATISVRYRKGPDGLKLALEGALPVPACAVQWFASVPPPQTQGWTTIEVGL